MTIVPNLDTGSNGQVHLATPAETAALAKKPVSAPVDLATQRERLWAVRTPEKLEQRCLALGGMEYLIDGLLPSRSIALIVGDSGLGKSPLLYQMGLCVAAGIPFLGRRVRQGRVLYMDFENGLVQSKNLITQLASHLGIATPPESFLVWNLNDSAPRFGQPGHGPLDIIKSVKPQLVFIDSFPACFPHAEEKNSEAIKAYGRLRDVIRDSGKTGTAIVGVHHIKKPPTKPDEAPMPLESSKIHTWFLQARGSRALINGCDIRIGVESARNSGTRVGQGSGVSKEAALLLRGFGRVMGEIGPLYVARALDEDAEPLGYLPMTGVELLFNQEQEAAFGRLPDAFTFKEAKQIYGKHDQATRDFVKKCMSLDILRQPEKGRYEKVR